MEPILILFTPLCYLAILGVAGYLASNQKVNKKTKKSYFIKKL